MKGTVEKFLKRIDEVQKSGGNQYYSDGADVIMSVINQNDKNTEDPIKFPDLWEDIQYNTYQWSSDYDTGNLIRNHKDIKNAFEQLIEPIKYSINLSGNNAIIFQLYAIFYLRIGGNPNLDIYKFIPSRRLGNRGDFQLVNSIIIAFNLQEMHEINRNQNYDKELLKELIKCYNNIPNESNITMPFVLQDIFDTGDNSKRKLGEKIKFQDSVKILDQYVLSGLYIKFPMEEKAILWQSAKDYEVIMKLEDQEIIFSNSKGEKQQIIIPAVKPQIVKKKSLYLKDKTFKLEELFEVKNMFEEHINIIGPNGLDGKWEDLKPTELEITSESREIKFRNTEHEWNKNIYIPAGKLTFGERLQALKEKTQSFVTTVKTWFGKVEKEK